MVSQITSIAVIALSVLTGIKARDNWQITNTIVHNLPFPPNSNILFIGPSNTPVDLLQDIVRWVNRSGILELSTQRDMYIVINTGMTAPESEDLNNLWLESISD